MTKDKSPDQPEVMSWQEHAEGLVVGAIRGMAEAQAAMEQATGGALPPLSEMTMFEATELLAATLLEAGPVCSEQRSMPAASRKVGRDVLAYMKGLREQRGPEDEPTLFKILDQAGVERHRSH